MYVHGKNVMGTSGMSTPSFVEEFLDANLLKMDFKSILYAALLGNKICNHASDCNELHASG